MSNLKFDVMEDDLRELFSTVGELKSVHVIYDRSGRSLVSFSLRNTTGVIADVNSPDFNIGMSCRARRTLCLPEGAMRSTPSRIFMVAGTVPMLNYAATLTFVVGWDAHRSHGG